MLNVLISTDNVDLVKRLTNDILANNYYIRISHITTNIQETLFILNNANIDLIFLDSKMLNLNLREELSFIKDFFKNSIIISKNFDIIYEIVKTNHIIGYILEGESNEEIIFKIHKIIEKKDIELKRKKIAKELEYIKYNPEYKGTIYLIDTILQMYIHNDLKLNNLQKDIYPIIASKYKASVNTIRCSIRRATECMFYDCDSKKLNKYFGIIDGEKPTAKKVVYTVLEKIQ